MTPTNDPTAILHSIAATFGFDDDGPLTEHEIMQAILDEEGPEALVQAILDAVSPVTSEGP